LTALSAIRPATGLFPSWQLGLLQNEYSTFSVEAGKALPATVTASAPHRAAMLRAKGVEGLLPI
jgi:hypothetical protein